MAKLTASIATDPSDLSDLSDLSDPSDLVAPSQRLSTPKALTSQPRTWVEIDLSAILHNVRVVREVLGRGPGILAVVKANAYGHGAREVASVLAAQVDAFGVACVEEAFEISGLGPRILLLSPCLPSDRSIVVREGWIPSLSSASEAAAFAAIGPCAINFKIDTGMGRMGAWLEDSLSELQQLVGIPGISVHSISTHLPSADDDPVFTRDQLTKFEHLKRDLLKVAPRAKFHSLNSVGIFRFPQYAGDMVRVGLALYGCVSSPAHQPLLRPALTWKARLLTVREVGPGRSISYGRTFVTSSQTRVGSVSIGYADGFPRQVSGTGAQALVGGVRCPVLGRVTMDQILLDVSAVPAAQEGDEVVLLGRQGSEEIPAAELAAHADTIAWDVFTGLSGRVRRVFIPPPTL